MKILNLILLSILLSFFSTSHAHSADICDSFPTEENLEKRYKEIQDFWDKNVEQDVFTSSAYIRQETKYAHRVNTEIKIAYAVLKKPSHRANIIISNGRTETYLKYKELAAALWCKNYSVYMIDHRGQGLSSRILSYNKASKQARNAYSPLDYVNRGHVEVFDNYVSDIAYFIKNVVPNDSFNILLAHSMGGGIGARLIEKEHNLVQGAILSSPMLDIPSKKFGCPYIDKIAENIEGEDAFTPYGERWRHSDRYPYRTEGEFEDKVGKYFTRSVIRHNIWHEEYANLVNSVDERKVDLRIGSATTGWYDQACTAVEDIDKDANKITIPVLLLIAGDDEVVPQKGQRKFCSELNANLSRGASCELHVIQNARHEMFIETDKVRDEVLKHVEGFIAKLLKDNVNI